VLAYHCAYLNTQLVTQVPSHPNHHSYIQVTLCTNQKGLCGIKIKSKQRRQLRYKYDSSGKAKEKVEKLHTGDSKPLTIFELDIYGIRRSIENEETQTVAVGRLLFMASFI
jgi:hypothetical protein